MKTLFFAFENQAMCFNHILLYADEAFLAGETFHILFEGEAVKLPSELFEKKHPLFLKAIERGQILGICEACSKMLGVYEVNEKLGLPFLGALKGHPSLKEYQDQGYQVYFK